MTKKIKVSNKPKKLLTAKRMLIIIAAIGVLTAGWAGYQYLVKNDEKGDALKACEQLYKDKVDRFTEQTGLNHGNIVFDAPQIEMQRNLYILKFNDIALGDQADNFVCYYNVSTKKPTDRTPEPDFGQKN